LRSALALQVTSARLGAAGAAVIGGSIIIGAGIIAAGGGAYDNASNNAALRRSSRPRGGTAAAPSSAGADCPPLITSTSRQRRRCRQVGLFVWKGNKAGYVVAALVTLRIVWGFVGPRHARFADFVRAPREVLAYFRDVLLLRAQRYIGHNPAGGHNIRLTAPYFHTGQAWDLGQAERPAQSSAIV
jgi:hypothetical protein